MTAQTAQGPAGDDVVLRVRNVGKAYGGTVALRDVSFDVRRGSVHGLLGENGAGKSTLVGIVSGQRRADTGTITLDGRVLDRFDVRSMERAGVFLVTQEPMIVDHLSAAENLLLGIWPRRLGFVNWRRLRADAARMLEGTGIDPNAGAGRLDAVARRKLNILRAMFSGGTVIILDEPTAALTAPDRQILFDFMRRLRAQGVTFIFISHYNDEILEICDGVSVLRDGILAGGSDDVSTLTSERLSELVLGRGLVLFQRRSRAPDDGPPAVMLRDVVGRDVRLDRLDIGRGEIIGLTGLPGAGAKELARTVFGLMPSLSGTIRFAGEDAVALPRTPRDAFASGIGFLSDDRRRDGVVGPMVIADNIALSSLDARSRAGFIDFEAEASVVSRYFGAMAIKAPGAGVAVDTLSGGNQQKVCLARVMAARPRLLILDEPTRGIDVGVKQDVLRIVDGLSREGMSVIIVSTDADELSRVADRVCVFEGGSIRETLTGSDIASERLRRMAAR